MSFLLNFLGPVGVFIKLGLSLLSGNAGGLLKTALDYWAHKSDVDLSKVQAAVPGVEHVAVAALQADVAISGQKLEMAKSLLNNPIIAFAVAIMISLTVARFCLVLIDSTWWSVVGCEIKDPKNVMKMIKAYGDACAWNIPPIKGVYGNVEVEVLLFWIISKPVNALVTGGMNVLTSLVRKNA